MARGTDELQNQTRLQKRNGVYYFRIKVPVDLIPAYHPRRELKWSLKTKDLRVAKRLVAQASVQVEAEFELRRRAVPAVATTADGSLVELSDIDDSLIEAVCTTWLREALDFDVKGRTDPSWSSTLLELRQEGLSEKRRLFSQALARGETHLVEEVLDTYLRHLGFTLTCAAADRRRLQFAFLQTIVKELDLLSQRDEGLVVETESAAPLARTLLGKPADNGLSLTNLYEDWKTATTRNQKTADDYERVVNEFSQFVKNKAPARLTKQDFLKYRDHLGEQRQHWKTVEKKLGVLKTVLRLGVDNDKLPANPCERIRVERPKAEKKARLPFDGADLRVLFESPVFSSGHRPKGGADEAAFWLPLIGAFTGAREEELAQLLVTDIIEDEAGWYIRISDDAEHGTLKNSASRRRVPVHAELAACGFLQYVAEIKDAGEAFLFPALKADKYGKRSAAWSKWFGRYMRRIGITDTRKVFHSFRHSFKHACKENGIEEIVHDALTGHAGSSGSEGRKYGAETYPLQPLFYAMKRFKYKGLDLTHLHIKERSTAEALTEVLQPA